MSDLLVRLRVGAWYGFVFACFYALYSVGLYLVHGARPFAANDTTLRAALAAYFVGGVVAGAIVGALQPLTRSRVGAMFVYSVAAFFVFLSIAAAADGIYHIWWTGCLIAGIVFGTVGSFAWRKLIA